MQVGVEHSTGHGQNFKMCNFCALSHLDKLPCVPLDGSRGYCLFQSQSQFYLSISSHVLDIQRNRNYVSHYPMRLHRQQQQQQ